jgi:hypothetical protein
MKRIWPAVAAAWALSFSACGVGTTRDNSIREVDERVRQLDTEAGENRTLAALAKMEESLNNYIQNEKKIPGTIEEMIPKYLAEMPTVEINVRGHHDNDKVKVYPATILRDGAVDGTKLKDTGYWGYVFNDRQVVVFVDCTHKSRRGRAWYLERGVY